MKRMATK